MKKDLRVDILPQPDDSTCGPTCLHAVYRYFRDDTDLTRLIGQIERLRNGGTLGVLLANHALLRGYRATLYTYNLQVFDPTWFESGAPAIRAKLAEQAQHKDSKRLHAATKGYLEFLDLGGTLAFEDLTRDLIFGHLRRGVPMLTGLSATYLYRCPREHPSTGDYDDVRGVPMGHFVILCGMDTQAGTVLVADPLYPNPRFEKHHYELDVERVMDAILLGILTYDANLLVLERPTSGVGGPPGGTGAERWPS